MCPWPKLRLILTTGVKWAEKMQEERTHTSASAFSEKACPLPEERVFDTYVQFPSPGPTPTSPAGLSSLRKRSQLKPAPQNTQGWQCH